MSETSDKAPQPAQEATGKCVVVFGTKGGVGKTVVAPNLAVSLSQRLRKPVCLVDLDVTATGDLAKMLGPPHPPTHLGAAPPY